ncbi:MAG: radical SAM protein [Pseudomonadota bacterium]
MNLLLVYGNIYELYSPPPVGLALLTAPLREAGHRVRVVELMKTKDPDRVLADALAAGPVDLVGFSLRNLDNMDSRDLRDFVPDYVRWVGMANAVAPTIIGGSAVTAAPDALLRRTAATYGMAGQGDRALPMFLEELDAGRAGGFQTPGLLWREAGQVRQNPGLYDGYATRGSLDWESFDYKRYRGRAMKCCVITKTGCPHRCIFCDAHETFGAEYVPRAPEAIVEDLRCDAAERGSHRLDYIFIDACFNEPPDWAREVLEALIRYERKLLFVAIVEPTATVDRELVRLLRRAGCGMVTSLVGSLDDAVLARSRRPFTVADALRCFELFEEEQVPYMPQLLLGGPGETPDTVTANHARLKRRRPLIVEASHGLRILPKAGLREVALGEGVIAADDDLLTPRFYLSEPLRGREAWLDQQTKRLGRFRLSSLPQWWRYIGAERALAKQV